MQLPYLGAITYIMLFDFTFRVPFGFRNPFSSEIQPDEPPSVSSRPRPILRAGIELREEPVHHAHKRRRQWQPIETISAAPPLTSRLSTHSSVNVASQGSPGVTSGSGYDNDEPGERTTKAHCVAAKSAGNDEHLSLPHPQKIRQPNEDVRLLRMHS